jgi:hypothetical protein
LLFTGIIFRVQLIPFLDTILPVGATAINSESVVLQSTEVQFRSLGVVLRVQAIPLGLVITLEPVPVLATATNKVSEGLQVILCQLRSSAETLEVQVIASGLVITLLPLPLELTAANKVSS